MSGGKFRVRRLQRDAALFQCVRCFQRVPTDQIEMAGGKPSCAACRKKLAPPSEDEDRT